MKVPLFIIRGLMGIVLIGDIDMKIQVLIKIGYRIYKILGLVILVLLIIQCVSPHDYDMRQRKIQTVIIPFYNITLVWLYITALIILIKSIIFFKRKEILLGIITAIVSLLLFLFSHYLLAWVFTFIYSLW